MGIAVGSVGAMRSDVGGISSVAVGIGCKVPVIRVELVAVAVTVGVIVAVTVISWVGVEDPLCKKGLDYFQLALRMNKKLSNLLRNHK